MNTRGAAGVNSGLLIRYYAVSDGLDAPAGAI